MRSLGLVAALFAGWLFTACEEPQKSAEEPTQEPSEQTKTDTSSGPPMGEPPSPNQPQPVYPEGKTEGL